jgi:hypothetical protein
MEDIERPSKDKLEPADEHVSSYGLLSINHAYNEGKITYWEWLKLSREWAEQIIRQNTKNDDLKGPKH